MTPGAAEGASVKLSRKQGLWIKVSAPRSARMEPFAVLRCLIHRGTGRVGPSRIWRKEQWNNTKSRNCRTR